VGNRETHAHHRLRFPLAKAKQAQELLEKGGVIGKIVLVREGSSQGLKERIAELEAQK
jgi:hypothetical protein